jgi:hypothetical protein
MAKALQEAGQFSPCRAMVSIQLPSTIRVVNYAGSPISCKRKFEATFGTPPLLGPSNDNIAAFEVPEEEDMASEANYKLSGTGVQLSYSAGTTALEIVLDDSFPEMKGAHQLSGAALTKIDLDEYGFAVSGTIDNKIRITRTVRNEMFRGLHLTLYLPNVDPPFDFDAQTEVPVTGAVVLIGIHLGKDLLPKFQVDDLKGTVTWPKDVAGRGSGGR